MFYKMNEIKDCPFCGSHGNNICVITTERNDRTDCKWTAKISCLNCFGNIYTHGFHWTEQEAKDAVIKAWNRRANGA